jgi:arylsulfatase A-like enzyme
LCWHPEHDFLAVLCDDTFAAQVMRLRWGALLAVDDLVEGVITALDAVGVLNQTFVFYWSDHGYHLGSFRLAEGKMHFCT